MLLVSCGGTDAAAPHVDPTVQVPAGMATVSLFGDFSGTQHDSISQRGVFARMWRQPATKTGGSGTGFAGSSGLMLTWPGTPGGSAPEPRLYVIDLPIDISGHAPRTFSFQTDSLVNDLTAGRVNNGEVVYQASYGTVTVTAATDSTMIGTIIAGFDRGPLNARLILSGQFNATLCGVGVSNSTPCVPPQVY